MSRLEVFLPSFFGKSVVSVAIPYLISKSLNMASCPSTQSTTT